MAHAGRYLPAMYSVRRPNRYFSNHEHMVPKQNIYCAMSLSISMGTSYILPSLICTYAVKTHVDVETSDFVDTRSLQELDSLSDEILLKVESAIQDQLAVRKALFAAKSTYSG